MIEPCQLYSICLHVERPSSAPPKPSSLGAIECTWPKGRYGARPVRAFPKAENPSWCSKKGFGKTLTVYRFFLATKSSAHRAMMPVMVVKKNRVESVFHDLSSIQNRAARVKWCGIPCQTHRTAHVVTCRFRPDLTILRSHQSRAEARSSFHPFPPAVRGRSSGPIPNVCCCRYSECPRT